MIRCGKLCQRCTKDQCADLSTAAEPILIECPDCSGTGCGKCDDGQVGIEGCPNRFCSSVVRATDLIDLFGKGLPPVAGGVLDQAVSFIEAARFLQNDERALIHE